MWVRIPPAAFDLAINPLRLIPVGIIPTGVCFIYY